MILVQVLPRKREHRKASAISLSTSVAPGVRWEPGVSFSVVYFRVVAARSREVSHAFTVLYRANEGPGLASNFLILSNSSRDSVSRLLGIPTSLVLIISALEAGRRAEFA